MGRAVFREGQKEDIQRVADGLLSKANYYEKYNVGRQALNNQLRKLGINRHSHYTNKDTFLIPKSKEFWEPFNKRYQEGATLMELAEETGISDEEIRVHFKALGLPGLEKKDLHQRVHEKRKKTNLERLGVEYAAQSFEVREKMKSTNFERRGVEYAAQSDEVKNKVKETNLDRYGTGCSLANKEVREKCRETLLRNYRVDNPQKNKEINERTIATNMERYGGTGPSCSPDIRKKQQETCLKNHGVLHPQQSKEINAKGIAKRKETWVKEIDVKLEEKGYVLLEEYKQLFLDKEDEVGRTAILHKVRHLKCGYEYEDRLDGEHPRCPECYPKEGPRRSHVEIKYQEHLENLGLKVESGVRNKLRGLNYNDKMVYYEMDIYLPEQKIGIEVNGLYFHALHEGSNASAKSEDYHSNKSKIAREVGIDLYHIWEFYAHEKVKLWLTSLLGKGKVLHASNLAFKEVEQGDAELFVGQNSLDRVYRYGRCFALVQKETNEIIYLSNFIGGRNGKFSTGPLISKLGYIVEGGEKLLLEKSLEALRNNHFRSLQVEIPCDLFPDYTKTVFYEADFNFENWQPSKVLYTNFKQVLRNSEYRRLDEDGKSEYSPIYRSGSWLFSFRV